MNEDRGIVSLNDIHVPNRLRSIDPAWVEALASSVGEIGLNQPIVVMRQNDGYRLIAGAHRLEAFRLLDRKKIPAVFVKNLTEDQARLIEIDENLMRRELNAFDRMAFIAERRDVWEKLHGNPHGGDRKSKNRDKNQTAMFAVWSGETQQKTGLSNRMVRHILEIYNAISPETRQIVRGSWLADNGAQLKALAQCEDKKRQAEAAKLMIIRPNDFYTAQAAYDFMEYGEIPERRKTPQEKKLEALLHAWNEADLETRTQFMQHVGLRYAGHELRVVADKKSAQ